MLYGHVADCQSREGERASILCPKIPSVSGFVASVPNRLLLKIHLTQCILSNFVNSVQISHCSNNETG